MKKQWHWRLSFFPWKVHLELWNSLSYIVVGLYSLSPLSRWVSSFPATELPKLAKTARRCHFEPKLFSLSGLFPYTSKRSRSATFLRTKDGLTQTNISVSVFICSEITFISTYFRTILSMLPLMLQELSKGTTVLFSKLPSLDHTKKDTLVKKRSRGAISTLQSRGQGATC